VADITEAHHLLTPMLGAGIASVVFAVALLAAGQTSTVTGTLAGQIVMEGFVDLRMPAWARRIVTRLIAVVPAAFVAAAWGDAGETKLLILSQVILSLQLPFAVIPMVSFTNDRALMGSFANGPILKTVAWTIAAAVTCLNLFLLWTLV
jgi:manganese transport protein